MLVSLGGDIATAALRATAWSILVSDGPGQPEAHVTLPAGAALATSSTISRTWRRGGQSMHHVLDPRTSLARPDRVAHRLGRRAHLRRANTLTTAAIVRGHGAVPWLASQGITARLVTACGDVVRVGGWPKERAA